MTQFAILQGPDTAALSLGMFGVRTSSLGGHFAEVSRHYGMGATAWIPIAIDSDTQAFDSLVVGAQRTLTTSCFPDTLLSAFLLEAIASGCSICLWYAQDYSEIEWFTDANVFMKHVEVTISQGAGEVYAGFRGRPVPVAASVPTNDR